MFIPADCQVENLLGPVERLLRLRRRTKGRDGSDGGAGGAALTVVDMCASSGHVGLAVAGFLGRGVRVEVNDLRARAIAIARARLRRVPAAVRARVSVRVEDAGAHARPFDVGPVKISRSIFTHWS